MSKNPLRKATASYYALYDKVLAVEHRIESLQQALGRIESRQIRTSGSPYISDHEFKVFSQWGEDGILDFLTDVVGIKNKVFVEFGVENYLESNTRFLLENKNWAGLVIDGSKENIATIINSDYYWKHNLKAVEAFVDAENINDLLKNNGVSGEIGILSIDIDGNDYWVWNAINCVSPAIVSIEYNSRLGWKESLTIPYGKDFYRPSAHYSYLYYGASLKALYNLARSKGYTFVGCNSAGVNAFFVRDDLMNKAIKPLKVKEGFVRGAFRESRNQAGAMAYLSQDEENKLIKTFEFINPDAKK